MATFHEATGSQGCGIVRSQSFFGGVGVRFLTTVEVWVRFYCPTPKSNWTIFYVTLLSWEFLLKWYNFLWNFCWDRFPAVYHNFYCSWQPNFIQFMLRNQKFGKVRVRSRSRKFWKGWSQKFYLWLCNPARSCAVSIQMFIGLILTAKQTFMTHKQEHDARNLC